MSRSRSVPATALLVSCALLSSSIPAFAQPKAPAAKAAPAKPKKGLRDSLSGEARDAFDRGVQLYQGGNFDGATSEFERAYALSHDPRLLFNMAIADRDNKRYSRAVRRLEQELSEGATTLTDAEKKTATDLLEALKQFTAPLTISVNEPDATVLVDGVEVGKSPIAQPVTVDVGERTISARKNGFAEASRRVSIAGGKADKVDLALEASQQMGKLVVRANGSPNAVVFLDGTEQGPTPWEGNVTATKHTIEIRARGFVTESRTETIAARSTTVIEVPLRADQGRVHVETDKSDSLISVDGHEVGRGTWDGTVTSGSHRLEVTRGGYEPYSSDLIIQTDQQRSVKVTLRSKGGVPWYAWVIGGVVLAGAGVGGYFLFRPGTKSPPDGSISPGTVPVGYRF